MTKTTKFFGSIMIKVGFTKLKDSEGMIDVEGVKEIIQANLISLRHPFVVAILDNTKHIQKYNYNEFYELYKTVKENTSDKSQEEMLEMFKKYDVVEDGFVTKDDLKQCLRADRYYHEDELDTIVELVMKFGDENNDGKLNYIEFVEMISDNDIL